MLQLKSQQIDIDSIHPVDFLKAEFGWTLQRIADEMGYSIGAVLAWSSRKRSPLYRAKEKAYEVYLRHVK